MNYKIRHIEDKFRKTSEKSRGRLLVLTGARQVGKSTLARRIFPDWGLVSMDSPIERSVYERYSPEQWIRQYPRLIVDEVQKAPDLFDTLKACYDRAPDMRMLLLGSSQVLLMKGVRESLAGRAALQELLPFSLCECMGLGEQPSLLERLLRNPAGIAEHLDALPPDVTLSSAHAEAVIAWDKLSTWGGMPFLWQEDLDEDDRGAWLKDFCLTYLQRDLADLARLDRLEPFVRAQRVAALRSAQCLNFSDLARAADIPPTTARSFLRYLELSYQVVLLPAWSANEEKRLVKMPKLHFLDAGIRRSLLGKHGPPDGAEFESMVFAELHKLVRNADLPWRIHHLRTADGREVDLLLEHETGFVAIECKNALRTSHTDFRHLRNLEELLPKPILLKLLLSMDPVPRRYDVPPAPAIALPAPLLFSPLTGLSAP